MCILYIRDRKAEKKNNPRQFRRGSCDYTVATSKVLLKAIGVGI